VPAAQPGHLLGPVTESGRVQPSQKKIKKLKNKKNKKIKKSRKNKKNVYA
jgi:hypothetical protein